MKNPRVDEPLPNDPFAYIAFWQFMTFIMLLLLVWFNELQGTSELFFDAPPEDPNFLRASLLTIGVLFAAVVTIGNTYLQQRRVLRKLLRICSKCHKVMVSEESWQRIEDYISDRSLMSFTHGLCPQCHDEMISVIKERKSKIIPV